MSARTIKLYCPSLSRIVPFVAWDEQKLDLGSIARTFGLDPSTLKLNGHFISRGVDLISSSVTWRSLLSFFSAKGLSTGKDDRDALIVEGKFCKVGTKRAPDPGDAASGLHYISEQKELGLNRRPLPEDNNVLQNKKLKERHSGCEDRTLQWRGLGLKRKQLLEDLSQLKKLKINESNSDFRGRGNAISSTMTSTPSTCSYLSENMKRMREDEATVAVPCRKKIK